MNNGCDDIIDSALRDAARAGWLRVVGKGSKLMATGLTEWRLPAFLVFGQPEALASLQRRLWDLGPEKPDEGFLVRSAAAFLALGTREPVEVLAAGEALISVCVASQVAREIGQVPDVIRCDGVGWFQLPATPEWGKDTDEIWIFEQSSGAPDLLQRLGTMLVGPAAQEAAPSSGSILIPAAELRLLGAR